MYHPPAFPWVDKLDPEDVNTFLRELAHAGVSGLEEVNKVVHEWQVTAEAWANPDLRKALAEPLVPSGSVPHPDAVKSLCGPCSRGDRRGPGPGVICECF